MYNQTDLRAAAARLLYSDNRDTADYNMLIEFIDDSFQIKLTAENFLLDDANVEALRKKLREAQPIIMTSHEEPSVMFVQNDWIPVTERLPKKSGEYLVAGAWRGESAKTWICEFLDLGFGCGWANNARNPVVAHWMPLPEPPNEYSHGK